MIDLLNWIAAHPEPSAWVLTGSLAVIYFGAQGVALVVTAWRR